MHLVARILNLRVDIRLSWPKDIIRFGSCRPARMAQKGIHPEQWSPGRILSSTREKRIARSFYGRIVACDSSEKGRP